MGGYRICPEDGGFADYVGQDNETDRPVWQCSNDDCRCEFIEE